MNQEIFKDEAWKQSRKSSYKNRLGAVVVFRNKMVGRGFNKVHSTGARLDGKHAEIEALRNTTARYRKGCALYVCRTNKSGKLTMSKPCEACQSVMKKMGVKVVWYSNKDGSWERMSL